MQKRQLLKIRRRINSFAIVFSLLIGLLGTCLFKRQEVSAGTFDNAVEFYQTYGKQAVFHPTSGTDGNICFGSRGGKSSSNTKYSTIGWRLNITANDGRLLQQMYFKLDGNYISFSARLEEGSYIYHLYGISLATLRSRLNLAALQAVSHGNAQMTFDACMVVSKKGKAGGSMDDAGNFTGKVYTSYDGIVGAQSWSKTAKEDLHNYFGKTVSGLFYSLSVSSGSGIASVSGSGTYLYGTYVSLSATPATGYNFSYWNGSTYSVSNPCGFYISGNMSVTAYGTAKKTTVTFYRNAGSGDSKIGRATYSYTGTGQTFPNFGWTRDGYRFKGWSFSRTATSATYSPTNGVSASWVNAYSPSTSLYGVWKENSYIIDYDLNGTHTNGNSNRLDWDRAKPKSQKTSYSATISLSQTPENAIGFLGWSLSPDGKGALYAPGSSCKVADLATSLGVTNTDGASIKLYAIWDQIPSITVENLYFSMDLGKEGKLTEEYVASFARASDPEDGVISFGKGNGACFYIKDYKKDAIESLGDGESAEITFFCRDSSGNQVEKTVTLTLVDTTPLTGKDLTGDFRMISKDYVTGPAGLPEDSIWLTDPAYRALLYDAGLVE